MKPTELLAQIVSLHETFTKLAPEISTTLGEDRLNKYNTNPIGIIDELAIIRRHLVAMTDGRPQEFDLGSGYAFECAGRMKPGSDWGAIAIRTPDDGHDLNMRELKLLRDWLHPQAIDKIRIWIDAAIEFHIRQS